MEEDKFIRKIFPFAKEFKFPTEFGIQIQETNPI
jgi:hypothetical protein